MDEWVSVCRDVYHICEVSLKFWDIYIWEEFVINLVEISDMLVYSQICLSILCTFYVVLNAACSLLETVVKRKNT